MPPEPSHRDIETLWRDQTSESDPMTLEQIHALARRFDRKSRRALLVVPVVVALAALVVGQMWQRFHDPLSRTGLVLYLGGVLACAYLAYTVLFPRRDPAEPAGPYLRRQLQSALRNARGGWLRSLAILIPGLAVLEVVSWRNAHAHLWAWLLPQAFLVFAVAFLIAHSRRSTTRLKQELKQLDSLLGR